MNSPAGTGIMSGHEAQSRKLFSELCLAFSGARARRPWASLPNPAPTQAIVKAMNAIDFPGDKPTPS